MMKDFVCQSVDFGPDLSSHQSFVVVVAVVLIKEFNVTNVHDLISTTQQNRPFGEGTC